MSWEELLSIQESARADQEARDSVPPTGCPNDGEPLETNAEGIVHCKFDGWTWDGQPIRYS
jgi:hypothetical protein